MGGSSSKDKKTTTDIVSGDQQRSEGDFHILELHTGTIKAGMGAFFFCALLVAIACYILWLKRRRKPWQWSSEARQMYAQGLWPNSYAGGYGGGYAGGFAGGYATDGFPMSTMSSHVPRAPDCGVRAIEPAVPGVHRQPHSHHGNGDQHIVLAVPPEAVELLREFLPPRGARPGSSRGRKCDGPPRFHDQDEA